MKILFVICEGPHDAQFVGRLLQESGQYTPYEQKLKSYPVPLGEFFATKFQNRSVQELRIGKPDFPLVPICAYSNQNSDGLVFPISIGGIDNFHQALSLIKEIEESFAADALEVAQSNVRGYSVLFLYDADSRGTKTTVKLFVERFKEHYSELDENVMSSWLTLRGHLLSLFIFTDLSGETGVLEDILLELFRKSAETHVGDAEAHFGTYFEALPHGGDEIAHEAKRKKGILTTCGQMEKQNAGSALTVVIRDTVLLKGVFDFTDKTSQWYRLLEHINDAFK